MPPAGAGQRISEVCLVYELASRGDLIHCMRESGEEISCQRRVRVMHGIARGLNYLHCSDRDQPAFHRDIKGGNVVLTADYTPKIIDCGLSKYVPERLSEAAVSVFSTVGAKLGTPAYMCGQYIKAANMPFDAKCDIYGFGIVLCELLTGQGQGVVNEDGDLRFDFDTVDDLIPDERAGIWPPECVEAVKALIKDCLAKRAKRVSSMLSVLRTLHEINERFGRPSEMEERLMRENLTLRQEIERGRDERELERRLAEAEERKECVCCLGDYRLSEGVLCSNVTERHFMCFQDFCNQVKAASADLALFTKHGSAIVCCFCIAQRPPVTAKYADTLVCQVCSTTDADAMGAFLELRERATKALADAVSEGQIAQVREEEQERRLEETARLLSDEREKRRSRVEFHRLRIINRILSNHCPHCNLVILDWKNCDAVMHGPSEMVHIHNFKRS